MGLIVEADLGGDVRQPLPSEDAIPRRVKPPSDHVRVRRDAEDAAKDLASRVGLAPISGPRPPS